MLTMVDCFYSVGPDDPLHIHLMRLQIGIQACCMQVRTACGCRKVAGGRGPTASHRSLILMAR